MTSSKFLSLWQAKGTLAEKGKQHSCLQQCKEQCCFPQGKSKEPLRKASNNSALSKAMNCLEQGNEQRQFV